MPRQANGTYLQPANTTAVSGTTISSSAYNTLQTDLGNEITNSVDRGGRSAMAANLNLGSYQINNLANPSNSTDAANKAYADTKLPLAGGTMTGAISVNSSNNLGYLAWFNGATATASWGANSTYAVYIQNASGTGVIYSDQSGNLTAVGTISSGTHNVTGNVSASGTVYAASSPCLTAATYNSYAPTLTGGNASGTWGINVSGNAATATLASNANNSYACSGNAATATTATNQSGGTISASSGYIGSLGVGTAASGTGGEIRATNNITAYYSSDIQFKTNIVNISEPLQKIRKINGVEFDWTDKYIADHGGEDNYFMRKHDVGVIAQEIERVLPEVVATKDDGSKAVKYERICALLIEAVKELDQKVKKLEVR